jgi:hypothetical protein
MAWLGCEHVYKLTGQMWPDDQLIMTSSESPRSGSGTVCRTTQLSLVAVTKDSWNAMFETYATRGGLRGQQFCIQTRQAPSSVVPDRVGSRMVETRLDIAKGPKPSTEDNSSFWEHEANNMGKLFSFEIPGLLAHHQGFGSI